MGELGIGESVSFSLVCAAEAMALTQGDVWLVHRLGEGLCCRDDVVTEVLPTCPPSGAKTTKMEQVDVYPCPYKKKKKLF